MKDQTYRVEIDYESGERRDLGLRAGRLPQNALQAARDCDRKDQQNVTGRPVRYRVFDDDKKRLLLETETRITKFDLDAEYGCGGATRIPAGERLLYCCQVEREYSRKWQFNFQGLLCCCEVASFEAATDRIPGAGGA